MIAALALAMTACSTPEATPEAAPRVSVISVGPQVVQRDAPQAGRLCLALRRLSFGKPLFRRQTRL